VQPPVPLAMQWGGQVFVDGADTQGSSYALATSLSTICAFLDVDVIRDWNADQPDYWGAVGHYGIANKALGRPLPDRLKTLMNNNLDRITFDLGDVTKKGTAGLSKNDFVPLADVPDLVWKVGPHKRGGPNSPEHPNHFADMDRQLTSPLPEGDTLLNICDDPKNVAVAVWQRYYDAVQKEFPAETESRGLLPFRVWQIFDAMVYYVQQKDVEKFVCAAGILSHYVGDACQPLHISYLFNGDPDRTQAGDGADGSVSYGKGVHAAYEDNMVNDHVTDLWPAVDEKLTNLPAGAIPASGSDAAREVVKLMKQTFDAIKPMDIVEAFAAEAGQKPRDISDALWEKFGDLTAQVIADGSDCLARLWQGAWTAGNGDKTIKDLTAIDQDTLAAIYQDYGFLHSETLDTIQAVLDTGTGGADGSAAPARARSRSAQGRGQPSRRG
jgi:hypothetical protein